MIEGLLLTPLRQIPDDRGKVMHMLKTGEPGYEQFGEIYFSTVNPGAVKAWKLHRRMTLNVVVLHGAARLVVYDERPTSPTRGQVQEIGLGPETNYQRVTVPPGVWTGFIGLSPFPAILANCASIPHDSTEVDRKASDDPAIPYQWP